MFTEPIATANDADFRRFLTFCWSWSAMSYQQVWLRRLSVSIAKQEATASLVRVPLITRKAAMSVKVFGKGEGEGGERAEVRDTRVCVSLLLGTVSGS